MKALLNEIAGKTHNGGAAVTPAVFGMNFQSVYFGQSLNEPSVGVGGYKNAAAVPSDELLKEIEFVDASIGDIVHALKEAGKYDDSLTHHHGETWRIADRHESIRRRRRQYAGHAARERHPLLGVAAERNRHWRYGR